MQVSAQTLKDLEFPKILERISEFVLNKNTGEKIRKLKPYKDQSLLIRDLHTVNEYLSGLQSENHFPFSEFFYMKDYLSRMHIENYSLQPGQFLEIKSNTLQIKDIEKFLKEFKEYFPEIFKLSTEAPYEKAIIKEIDAVFNRHGEIKNSASPELSEIRNKIRQLSARISELFKKSMTHNMEYLDNIKESIVEDRRVLAVISGFRKRVKGRLLGTSNTGSISYIEPQSIQAPNRELDELREEEKKEVRKILISLTLTLAEYRELLEVYEKFLEYMDFTRAKAKFALDINGVLPQIKEENILNLIQAYHPLLYLANRERKLETIPQTLRMDEDCRIIIISGPNAGGKSITLKTIGLNQLMLQSGILIPVHPKSEIGFFEKILTDIGDNQSIENQLSTYSYRLKQMAGFIKKADAHSLLLIDEFGTGSDPELGGALAEVFFEEFYERGSFGVFTTHYTNIKLVAEELPQAQNASMLFDEKTLTPMYLLEVGQAGSSFTFEVAEKNRIPYRLINRAKKKAERGKVKLDKTILKLQQEKFHIQKTKDEVSELKQTSVEINKELDDTQQRIKEKLIGFQELYDSELKTLTAGRKLNEWADEYLKSKNKKKLIAQFMKWVEIENAKKAPAEKAQKQRKKTIQKQIQKELKTRAPEIEKVRKKIKKKKEEDLQSYIKSLKEGDRVKIKNSSSVAVIDKIEGDNVTLNYGHFTAKISIFEVSKI